ncbi:hypothetical protein LTR78_008094 [Recurvomyces mirabilis]|uniref:Major facilitator superfamily (MFS) profile domain-containing protein n=1 Tax=Recurvomyces mirabilis TaxID=574656 RepID=A0AAE0TTN6_9PEZI|nr:hypothetical protein LTR78_008094 [Recurvomyces mirabilis]KAK5150821.1 hypothetical protein LTS14_009885 [Recurvomyces mirabilis]
MTEKPQQKTAMPDHIENLDRTYADIDVVELTHQNPYREVNFIGTYIAALLACSANFSGFIMPVTALGLIEAELGASPNAVWISLGWVLLSGVSFVLLGRLSDIFGRRWFFTGSTLLSLVGAIIGATAQNINVLIAASVFLGMGSAGQISFNYSVGELVPIRHRFAANGIIYFFSLPFSGLGPYIARLLIVQSSAGWRGIYYLVCGLDAAAAILWLLFYHPPDFQHLHRDRTLSDELKELDLGGIILYVAGFFLFLLGLAWGGSVYPWTSAYVLAPLIIGFAVLVAFVLYESLMDLRRPLIPMHLFRQLDFVLMNVLSAVGGVVYYGANTLFPYMVGSLYTSDPIKGGLVASCIGAGVCAGQTIGSWIAVPGGHMKLKLIVISSGLCAFVAALSGATDSQAIGSALAVCAGLMVGLLEVIVSTIVTIVIADQSEIGAAAGVFGSIRSLAGVLATAIYLSVLMNKLKEFTASDVVPAVVQAGVPSASIPGFLAALAQGDIAALQSVPGVTTQAIEVGVATLREAYAKTFKIVWLGTLAFGLLAVAASCFTKDLDEKLSHDVVRRLGINKNIEDAEKLGDEKEVRSE